MISFKQFLLKEASTVNATFPVHNELNSKIWDGDTLRPVVKKALLKIAKEFEEFLDSPDVKVDDVTFTGSLANYNYTRHSDIDLHLIVNVSDSDNGDCKTDLQEFFMTKKNLWNQTHDISVLGFPVELYAQMADEQVQAEAVYSITTGKWIKKPKHKQSKYDKYAVEVKAQEFIDLIDDVINDKVDDRDYIQKIMTRIRDMRKSGLEKGGEFSEENLAFKVLRNGGHLERLNNYRQKIKTNDLSI